MSYNVSTMPTKFTLAKRIENLKNSMGNHFVDANIKPNAQSDRVYVEVITTLRPSLKMFEVYDTIMKPSNIIFDHQTLDHFVLNFIY